MVGKYHLQKVRDRTVVLSFLRRFATSNITLPGSALRSGRDEHKVCKMSAPNFQGHWSLVPEPNDKAK